jgi:muconolactone delta-isomerase
MGLYLGNKIDCLPYTDCNVSIQRMKITWTRRGISIAIAAALFLLLLFAHIISNAQGATYFHVTQSCHLGKCHKVKRGSIAITQDSIFIQMDGKLRSFKILKKSRYANYDLYEFDSFEFIKVFTASAHIIKWQDIEILTIIKA